MRPDLVLVLFLLAPLTAFPTDADAAAGGCPFLGNPDPPGDVAVWPGAVPDAADQHAAIDILDHRVHVTTDGDVVLEGHFSAAPSAAPVTVQDLTLTYRYWFGFHLRLPDGAVHYLDVRMHTWPYATGTLVGSNEMGNPRLAELAAEHTADTVRFRFPLTILQQHYGIDALEIGSPELQTDGPHPWYEGDAGVYALQTTKYIDYDFWVGDFKAVPFCG